MWLKEGDANSIFFNEMVASRRRNNKIFANEVNIERAYGVEEIRGEVFNYLNNVFDSKVNCRKMWMMLDFEIRI